LADAGIDPREVKVLRHTLDRVDLFAVWRNNRVGLEAYQAVQPRSTRGHFTRPWWATFIALPDGGTLFAGMYRVSLVGDVPDDYDEIINSDPGHPSTLHLYACERAPELEEYAGRLQISWSGRERKQNGEGGHVVTQIVDRIRDPDFPGLLEFIKPLSEVGRLPDGWRSHLRLGKGVYLLTCPKTREQYVGKADGEDGFLGRWLNYAANGHGGNIRLKSRDPSDYQVTVLEVAGSSATPREIGAMEERWKRKLQSRDMGLNAN
jgi:hypothetical protein